VKRLGLLLAVLALGLAHLAGEADAKRPPPEREVVEEADGDLVHLSWKDDPAAQAWLYKPRADATEEEGGTPRPFDLVVALHGAGGTPQGLLLQRVMEKRRAWCLAVAGHTAVTHEQGKGFQWDGSNVEYVLAFTRYLLEKYPLDRSRVIVWGHSAGGTMTLETISRAPEGLFAGGLTTAAPRTPDAGFRDHRVCVFLGTQDPNWSGAPAVRSYLEGLEKKKGKGACAFFAVEGLGHDLPEDDYLDLGFDWVLATGTKGGEATVARTCRGRDGDWRHILVRYKGAEGAGETKRTRAAAEKALKEILKDLEKGRAFFPLCAASLSEDEASADGGGGVGEEALAAFLGGVPDLEPGRVSGILSGPQGVHLVWRAPAEP
jgi:poly(3-hydroxybutyrate) depolymerase